MKFFGVMGGQKCRVLLYPDFLEQPDSDPRQNADPDAQNCKHITHIHINFKRNIPATSTKEALLNLNKILLEQNVNLMKFKTHF